MSTTVFLAICILGCDFLLYALYQWIFGEKRKALARDLAKTREKLRPACAAEDAENPRLLSFPPRPIQERTGYF